MAQRTLPDGAGFRRVSEAVLPTLRVIPNPRVGAYGRVETIGWVLPIDDLSFRIYTAGRVRASGDIARQRSRFNGKLWEELRRGRAAGALRGRELPRRGLIPPMRLVARRPAVIATFGDATARAADKTNF